MTATRPPRASRVRRWLLAAALVVSAFVFLGGGILAIYVARPQAGPARELLEAIESPIRQNEALQYNVHLALGKMFSLCPCTSGLSADQYRRASYHRPRPQTTSP